MCPCVFVCVYAHATFEDCVRVCVCPCVRARMRVRVCVCICMCVLLRYRALHQMSTWKTSEPTHSNPRDDSCLHLLIVESRPRYVMRHNVL